jgi:Ni,Fe-hydrogenase I large subunit
MEVGPLARALVGYAKGNQEVKEGVDEALKKLDVPIHRIVSHTRTDRRTRTRNATHRSLGERVLRRADR